MSTDENPMVQNRSMLKDFLASIATMSGDLSNITAPPFVLDTASVVEIPSFWAENPTIFVSPATSDDPVQRSLCVLRSFLSGMKSQCYMGHSPEEGVKKPINAFLGELFVGRWEDDNGTTHMLSEQVSHHPPITACRVWNDKYGIIAEGYNRQTVTFSGSVSVECTGHILKSLTKLDEHYLMPIPGFKVKGILGTPYPEVSGTYYIPSTNGYTSVIHFSGKSFFSSSSKKHGFTAHLYKDEEGESNALFTIEGQWDTEFTIRDNRSGKDVEVFNIEKDALKDAPGLILDPIEKQDPWESRRAWSDVIAGLKNGDMKGVSEAKGRLEEGQRAMREDEEKRGTQWKPLFFEALSDDKLLEQLNRKVPDGSFSEQKQETEGVWKFNLEAWKSTKKPYHGSIKPDNTRAEGDDTAERGSDQPEEIAQKDKEISSQPQQLSEQPATHKETDHSVGAVAPDRRAETNGTMTDVGRQPEPEAAKGIAKNQPAPQAAQTDAVNHHLGSGVQNMSIEEKEQIENMLRDQYSTASDTRRSSHAKRKSINHP